MTKPKYWAGVVPANDDFSAPITDTFYDAATRYGPWATMNHDSWANHRRYNDLGIGKGQKYEKQVDGRWLCTEGSST